ncbi:hypothetical protein, partial [Serratia marcescens]|uniref:hypothetical protein n=1 Tax=Serratia marcescens TaxID=615 RepID=UPI00195379DA
FIGSSIALAMESVMKQAWIGKIMPMGIGAVLGTMANRKLAAKVVHSTSESLGALPSVFDLE